MNPNQPRPDPSPDESVPGMSNAVMNKLKCYRWKGRALAAVALSVGLLSIVGGIFLIWGNSRIIFPQVQLLVQNSGTTRSSNTDSFAQTNADSLLTLSDGTTVDRQVLVTLMLGKAMNVTSLAVTLLGLGTLLTLLLVIFNRRVTLRQINTSLAQISTQIKELQDGNGPGTRQ
jgi:hypothetical protein